MLCWQKSELSLIDQQHLDVFAGFLTVYDDVILPSLSLLPNNCCISEEVWSFIRLLKYEHRSVQLFQSVMFLLIEIPLTLSSNADEYRFQLFIFCEFCRVDWQRPGVTPTHFKGGLSMGPLLGIYHLSMSFLVVMLVWLVCAGIDCMDSGNTTHARHILDSFERTLIFLRNPSTSWSKLLNFTDIPTFKIISVLCFMYCIHYVS